MADDLRKYAAQATCPVAIFRGSSGAELTLDQAKAMAACWRNASVLDIDGDYALQMENPAGLALALTDFAVQAAKD
jgi:pimeloyl-ACP methyl ester carboxylesterase